MHREDGEITTPIPRKRQARLAAKVRVEQGLAAAEAAQQQVAKDAAERMMKGRKRARSGVIEGTPRFRPARIRGIRRGSVVAEHYRIVDRIARGGTAIVYRAEHMGLGRDVALKILTPPHGGHSEEFEQRFVLEARALLSLHHPNIVEVFDFGRLQDGRCYLAMEFVEGHRLSDLFRDPGFSAAQRLEVLIGVARGIAHAHRHSIIHRDIKLSNAMVIQKGERLVVKVLDFGLAKMLGEDEQELTQRGVTLGSPHFMSPEQARGWDLDPRTDVYSLGVMTWCAFTGAYPFSGPTSAATMLQHVMEPVPSLEEALTIVPLPRGLDDTVRRCLAKDRDDRFDTAEHLIDALDTARAFAAGERMDVAPAAFAPPSLEAEVVLPPAANARRPFPLRLVLLGTLLISTACLWWQERGVAPAPWTPEYADRELRD